MDFTLDEALKMIQGLARKFIQEELLPLEKHVEETGEFSDDIRRRLRKKAVDLGLWSYQTPIEYGGGGVGLLGSVLIAEELGRVSQAVGLQGGVIGEGRETRLLDCNEQQKKEYLLPCIRGEKELFTGLTEPNAGSDTKALETRAVKEGNSYVINGTKTFITMADRADFGLVFAVTDPEKRARGGITCFIVDKGTPGFSISREIKTFGRSGLGVFELHFDNCVVPEGNVLGQVGHGLRIILRGLTKSRVRLAAYSVGAAERAQEMAMDYAKKRVTFGKPLAERQSIQNMLVDNATNIYASRMMTYNTAWEADQGMDLRTKAMMIKVFATEMACKVVDNAIQIHGGYGYSKDLVLEMIYRDVRMFRIADGATEMGKHWIASRLLGIDFS
ncbi:acyl-CoA dehydrogenase family protein [Chloroflexota bacterium]